MIVTTESGRTLTIPLRHPVFAPVGDYRPGQEVDPASVEVAPARAARLRRGDRLILDNRVEVVAAVAAVPPV